MPGVNTSDGMLIPSNDSTELTPPISNSSQFRAAIPCRGKLRSALNLLEQALLPLFAGIEMILNYIFFYDVLSVWETLTLFSTSDMGDMFA